MRLFVDPAEAPPPGTGGRMWDVRGVDHPGTNALTTLSSDPLLEQWDGFFNTTEVDALLSALEADSASGPDNWMPPWDLSDYKYSASGEAKLFLKYLHPSLGDHRSEAAVRSHTHTHTHTHTTHNTQHTAHTRARARAHTHIHARTTQLTLDINTVFNTSCRVVWRAENTFEG